MMLLLALAASSLPPQNPPVRVERSRDTVPSAANRVSTSLDTNGEGAGPQTPIDAERAFAADAKAIGQWTAFRKWSTDDAVMFVPQPINAHEFLKDRKDPPKPIDWWPTTSWISCDGSLAVNTGGWRRPDGTDGYFSTVWQRQKDGGWKWIADGGDSLKDARPRPRNPTVVRASCAGKAVSDRPKGDARYRSGASRDGTIFWDSAFNATGKTRVFSAEVWDGQEYRGVIEDLINVE